VAVYEAKKTCPECGGTNYDTLASDSNNTRYQCKNSRCLKLWVVTPELAKDHDGKFKPTGPGDEERVARQIEERAVQSVASGESNSFKFKERKAVESMAKNVKREPGICPKCGKKFAAGQWYANEHAIRCGVAKSKPAVKDVPQVIMFEEAAKPKGEVRSEFMAEMIDELEARKKSIIEEIMKNNPELARIDAAIKALRGETNPT
jgi:hypothetical protein